MSTPLPPGASFSCGDSPLSTTASVTGILTFVFAIAASLNFFLSQTKDSPQQIRIFIASLEASFREVDEFRSIVGQELHGVHGPAYNFEIDRIRDQVASQLSSLALTAQRYRPDHYNSRMKRWSNRVQFVLAQDELRGKVADKDRMMEDIRRVRDKYAYAMIDKLRQDEESKCQWDKQCKQQEDLLKRLDALEAAQRVMNEALITTTGSMSRTHNAQTGAGTGHPGHAPPGDSDAATT